MVVAVAEEEEEGAPPPTPDPDPDPDPDEPKIECDDDALNDLLNELKNLQLFKDLLKLISNRIGDRWIVIVSGPDSYMYLHPDGYYLIAISNLQYYIMFEEIFHVFQNEMENNLYKANREIEAKLAVMSFLKEYGIPYPDERWREIAQYHSIAEYESVAYSIALAALRRMGYNSTDYASSPSSFNLDAYNELFNK